MMSLELTELADRLMAVDSHTTELERSVRELASRITRLEGAAPADAPSNAQMEVVSQEIGAVLEMTKELFAERVTIESKSNPEFPDETWLAVIVHATGAPSELAARRRKWHQRLSEVAPSCIGMIRLSIRPE